MTEKMQVLCAQRDELLKTAKSLDAVNDYDKLNETMSKIDALDKSIDALEKLEGLDKEVASNSTSTATNAAAEKKGFKNFGEQLQAIMTAAKSKNRTVDKRLIEINNEIKGVNTETDADGGYAIQSDFIGNILEKAFERSQIVSNCREYTVSANSNRVNYVTVADENDGASEGVVVAGGVQAYWAGEGETVPPSKPKFKNNELKLGKIMGLAYSTEEALEDMPFLSQFLEDSFADAVAGVLTKGVLEGEGDQVGEARQPLGVLNSNALVSVTASGATVSAKDFAAMKAGMRKKNWANAVWYMHPDHEEDLPLLADEHGNLVYMPEGGISGAQYGTIFGRPVVFDEFLPAKGSKGSVLLADFNEYMLIKKGVERKEWSIHVEFLTDQQCFRIVLRVNGAPVNNVVYSVRNSTKKRGAFVALGAASL